MSLTCIRCSTTVAPNPDTGAVTPCDADTCPYRHPLIVIDETGRRWFTDEHGQPGSWINPPTPIGDPT